MKFLQYEIILMAWIKSSKLASKKRPNVDRHTCCLDVALKYSSGKVYCLDNYLYYSYWFWDANVFLLYNVVDESSYYLRSTIPQTKLLESQWPVVTESGAFAQVNV